MGIASFSPSLSRSSTPGLSMLLAPVQALVAFFMPVQPAQASYRPAARPAPRLVVLRISSAQNVVKTIPTAVNMRPISRLKVMCEFEPGNKRSHAGRMVISGRMADVCAELDRIAQKETRTH
jgi:hypothetical protein